MGAGGGGMVRSEGEGGRGEIRESKVKKGGVRVGWRRG